MHDRTDMMTKYPLRQRLNPHFVGKELQDERTTTELRDRKKGEICDTGEAEIFVFIRKGYLGETEFFQRY